MWDESNPLAADLHRRTAAKAEIPLRCGSIRDVARNLHLTEAGVDGAVHSDGEEPNVSVAKEILGYFLRNPNAADTLKEIARWRLMEEAVRRNVEGTQAALNWLVSEGYVREEMRLGTHGVFQLNSERRQDAELFLSKGPGREADG